MIPKEKAKELVDRYYWIFGDGYLGNQHIQCALIAVDEIIREVDWHDFETPNKVLNYWLKVKQEIEKL